MLEVNVERLRGSHNGILAEHEAMVAGVLYDVGGLVFKEVLLNPGFKPKTGATQRATQTKVVRIAGGRLLRIRNDKPTATFMEKGTKAHDIRPRKAKMLRFLVGDSWVFSRGVKHPGTKPYRTFSSAVGIGGSAARRMFEQRMRAIASRRY